MGRPIRNISEGRFRRRIINRPLIVSEIYSSNSIQNNKDDIQVNEVNYFNMSKNTQDYFKYINDINIKGNDDNLPFFVNLPVIERGFNISTFAEQKSEELIKVYNNSNIEKDNEYSDIVTVIPFRGRYLHLEKTIDSLIKSAKKIDKRIGFLIIENSQSPIIDLCKFDRSIVKYRWINSNGNIFNKCICHNVGAEITNSEYLHFHDCDLIVPDNFYSELFKKLETCNAVQCFTKRRVNYLHEEATKSYFDSNNIDNIISRKETYKEGGYGAPGGSIAITRNLYEKVGGFDSHFFWAYSIEDRFFWNKVEKFEVIYSMDNPSIELYHLWHPPGWGKNPYERFEAKAYQFFENDPNYLAYIETAKNIYRKTMNLIINNDNV